MAWLGNLQHNRGNSQHLTPQQGHESGEDSCEDSSLAFTSTNNRNMMKDAEDQCTEPIHQTLGLVSPEEPLLSNGPTGVNAATFMYADASLGSPV